MIETAPPSEMDRVIAKIQKLLLKTKDGSGTSEAEAESAMRVAQDLMSKYNLDMAVIEAAAGPAGPRAERVKEEMPGSARFKWQRQLAKYVAEANFCYHLLKCESRVVDSRGTHYGRLHHSYQHVFVGRKANVITAQLLYRYLTETIEGNVPLDDPSKRFSRSAISWREGCADRLCERLAARRRDLIEAHDAKVAAEQAAAKAEALRRHAERAAQQKRQLPANEGAEVDAAINGIAAEAHNRVGGNVADPAEQPAIDAADDWNPADAVEAPLEEPTGSALVLASEYDESEQEANLELANGWEPGEIARRRAQREENEREWAELKAEKETAAADAPIKEETERQRAARERREEKERLADRRRWAREDATAERREAREYAKKDHTAYRAGAEKGKSIGLDLQLKANEAKALKGGS